MTQGNSWGSPAPTPLRLVALTLADVTLHPADGLHVRLRQSKTDQEAHGQVKALPFGRDPVTCPPCA